MSDQNEAVIASAHAVLAEHITQVQFSTAVAIRRAVEEYDQLRARWNAAIEEHGDANSNANGKTTAASVVDLPQLLADVHAGYTAQRDALRLIIDAVARMSAYTEERMAQVEALARSINGA